MKYLILHLSILFFILSCNLENIPETGILKDEVVADNLATASALTNGTISLFQHYLYFKAIYQVPDYGSDDVALSGSTTDGLFYIYNYQRDNDIRHLKSFWEAAYKAIVSSNNLIELLEKNLTDDTKHLIGQNLYFRAYLYFTLVNIFGKQYMVDKKSLGVPLKITSDINDYPSRATVEEVYQQIVDDLIKAREYIMEPSTFTNISPTPMAASALLSRVYLYMGQWKEAELSANQILNAANNPYTLLQGEDYQKYSQKSPENNKETIFAINVTNEDALNIETYYYYYTLGSLYASIRGVGWGEMYASSTYRELLDQNPEDLRHGFIARVLKDGKWANTVTENNDLPQWVIAKISDNSGIERFYNYPVTKDGSGNWTYRRKLNMDEDDTATIVEKLGGVTPNYTAKFWINDKLEEIDVRLEDELAVRNGFPKYYILKCSQQDGISQLWSPIVSRLGEIYLNRAEARANQGDEAGAISDLNIIRKRANIPEIAGVSGQQLIDTILTERRLELAFEGHRKYDLFRNGKALYRYYPGTHNIGDNPVLKVLGTDDRAVHFIPISAIQSYPGSLEQNP